MRNLRTGRMTGPGRPGTKASAVLMAAAAAAAVMVAVWRCPAARADEAKFSTRGPTETTPSYAQYFSWINNTNEGSTEANTLANLAFFRWLHDEYGMVLDIYAWDAGNIDGPHYYGSMSTDKFKKQFPRGWTPIAQYARQMNTRLGIWLGPDGFGETPAEEKARHDLLVSFCRDYDVALFKMDAVCSQLREEKQQALKQTLIDCRKHQPDLILLNHRLKLGVAEPYATTFLWGGAETYIDVHMGNGATTATHHRAGAMGRGLPPGLKRLTEDHGVCISSCPDFWDDDMVLQAFNRCLILSPEMYGNPWFLRDDEFPKLARLYNLHRRWRAIMVQGIALPEAQYGPYAVSRGNAKTRLITLRNLTWEPVEYTVQLDRQIGLTDARIVELRQFHPTERIIGRFTPGSKVKVKVMPFRACLLLATTEPVPEVGLNGCDYQVVRDVPGKPVIVKLLGMPQTTAWITLAPTAGRTFQRVRLNGQQTPALLAGRAIPVKFGGRALHEPWHRKLGDLEPTVVPADAEALYEATCFAADNNALEYRAIKRSGPTRIPQVKKARQMFFDQSLLRERGCWDRFMFDGDEHTGFGGGSRARAIRGGALRLDFGEARRMKSLSIEGRYDPAGQWTPIDSRLLIDADGKAGALTGEYFNGDSTAGSPVTRRRDRRINYRWWRAPQSGVNVKAFAVRWTGKLISPTDRTGRLVVACDGRARLWLDGRKVIDADPLAPTTRVLSVPLTLKAGRAVTVKLEYGHRGDVAEVRLGWASGGPAVAEVSKDLSSWRVAPFVYSDGKVTVDLSDAGSVRYFRMTGTFGRITEVTGRSRWGTSMRREAWRGSNLFAAYKTAEAVKAWQCSFTLDEAARGSYLCLAINGKHGVELAYAALRVAGRPVGCPDRARSYPTNPWEYPTRMGAQNTTYYVPVTEDMLGKPIDAVVLGLAGGEDQVAPQVWLTAHPVPYESAELILEQ